MYPSTSISLLFRQVRDGVVRQLDEEVRQEFRDLGFTHYVGLKVLAIHAPCTANKLAQALNQTPSAVTRLLDKLEAMDAVRREPHAQDRRALQIVMTETGRALWGRLQQHGERAIAYALRDLSEDEQQQLIHLLTRIRDSLNVP
ncbi:MarR family transcriptional regulator [Xylella taiwanensis]|uniref:MarR family transcriptional regulator n=1 Tax=Xylella taiwanensis TaxID=1444770 RepID=Z9JG79_9GAMM|nr:MarR family transcriptional regulator [Xylella taiwanensis]AXI83148.1 MarR family transcriptional regulator [Xylella taiwanensis]EWS77189.1 MarR family transcriptional regulator [Xylella taiwanensis]MCD8456197.1 MarR family transcriptional regulator [Xylella taiwanensis]MCD8458606.1 MarR family transcriptional regulator [Xylella taiwanensis]MCD8460740.1 MarR family transcriptional regulator [Xylella taiwanensis]